MYPAASGILQFFKVTISNIFQGFVVQICLCRICHSVLWLKLIFYRNSFHNYTTNMYRSRLRCSGRRPFRAVTAVPVFRPTPIQGVSNHPFEKHLLFRGFFLMLHELNDKRHFYFRFVTLSKMLRRISYNETNHFQWNSIFARCMRWEKTRGKIQRGIS